MTRKQPAFWIGTRIWVSKWKGILNHHEQYIPEIHLYPQCEHDIDGSGSGIFVLSSPVRPASHWVPNW